MSFKKNFLFSFVILLYTISKHKETGKLNKRLCLIKHMNFYCVLHNYVCVVDFSVFIIVTGLMKCESDLIKYFLLKKQKFALGMRP